MIDRAGREFFKSVEKERIDDGIASLEFGTILRKTVVGQVVYRFLSLTG